MRERRAGSRGIAAEQRRRDWYVEWAADDDARLAVMETGQLSVRFGEGVGFHHWSIMPAVDSLVERNG